MAGPMTEAQKQPEPCARCGYIRTELKVSREWLRNKIAADPDLPSEAGNVTAPHPHAEPLYDDQAEADSFDEFYVALIEEARKWKISPEAQEAMAAMLTTPHRRLWERLQDAGREANSWAAAYRSSVIGNDHSINICAQTASLAEGPIDTYWIRRREADPLHSQLTGCLCDACQNERGYYSRRDAGLTIAGLAALLYELPMAHNSPEHYANPAMFYCATQATWLLSRLAHRPNGEYGGTT